MVKRYVIAPRARWSNDLECEVPEFVGTIVHEPEPRVRDTGLLDASGQPILSVDEMGPIGFIPLR